MVGYPSLFELSFFVHHPFSIAMLYRSFVILHILSVGVLIGLFTVSVIGTSMRRKVAGTAAELASIRSGATMAPIMANIGSIGLLISGIIMTLMHYSFFPFATVPWLAVMQTDFLVIMAISGAILAPNGKKILALSTTELGSPLATNGASPELQALLRKQMMVQVLVAVLVLVAITMGESKSMTWGSL